MIVFFKRYFSCFAFLNITQFLGALNDNVYKLLVIFLLLQLEGIENSHKVLATSGMLFVLPFLLFSAWAGNLADRFSKRNVIVASKVLECLVMLLGLAAFFWSSKYGAYAVLFLMAAQSALFCPSKYGIVREIVSPDKIIKANGLMTAFTYLAVIFGTFLASFLIDVTHRNFTMAAVFCVVVAFIGTFTSFCIGHTPPSGSTKRIEAFFFTDLSRALKIARRYPSLLTAILGSSYFLFLGAFVQLNLIPFAVESLKLSDVQGGYLFLLTALGIGLGSFIAGKISGKTAELALVPLAGTGIVFCLYGIDFFSGDFLATVTLVALLGFLGGIYLLPLDSFIQMSSPKTHIGKIIAAHNVLSFIGVLLASLLMYAAGHIFHIRPDTGFSVVACITIVVNVLLAFQFFDYLVRFIGGILSRIRFKTTVYAAEDLPKAPVLYVCSRSLWHDILLILESQRSRIRFFIEGAQEENKFLKKLYHFLKISYIPEMEALKQDAAHLELISKTLKKGVSVCLFIDAADISDFDKLKQAGFIGEILQGTSVPMLGVVIEKEEKCSRIRYFTKVFEKFRAPAAVSFEAFSLKGSPAEMNFKSGAEVL